MKLIKKIFLYKHILKRKLKMNEDLICQRKPGTKSPKRLKGYSTKVHKDQASKL